MASSRDWTDEELEKMEKRITAIYEEAQSGIREKWDAYMERAEKRIERYEKALEEAKAGGDKDEIKKAENELKRRKENVTIRNEYYQGMIDETTDHLANVNNKAVNYLNGTMPTIYREVYNWAEPNEVRIDMRLNVRSEQTVARLIKSGDIQLPKKKLDIPKDKRWNTKQLNSSVLQGILQGEDMRKIAKRIQPVVDNNKSAAIRNARTMVTGAENAGKQDRFKSLEEKGAIIKKVWMATPDGRTRDSHIDIDGEEVEIGENFSNGLEYPGDPGGDPAEVYNCRCTMHSNIIGFRKADGDIVYIDGYDSREETMHERQMEEEQERREAQQSQVGGKRTEEAERFVVVQGKDISETWERRKDQFAFEIEDVINAQGFDGLPRVVSREEFNKAVAESNFIAQRTYSAPDQETLDSYRDQLYHGKWYVDCSNGGAALGKGMYSVYTNGTSINEYMEREINGYRNRRGAEHNYVETFTLEPGAKTITPNKIIELRREAQKNLMAEFEKRGGWDSESALEWVKAHDRRNLDDGSFAALMGYDAILTHDIDDYAVILNRTKCIFLGD